MKRAGVWEKKERRQQESNKVTDKRKTDSGPVMGGRVGETEKKIYKKVTGSRKQNHEVGFS